MQDLRNILYRVDMARRDRDRHEWWINEALRLSCPTYRRLNDPIDPNLESALAGAGGEWFADQIARLAQCVAASAETNFDDQLIRR